MRLENEKFGDIDSIGVRLPSALKAKIKEAAKQNKHSMNAEIVTRLEKSFLNNVKANNDFTSDDMTFIMTESIKRLLTEGLISVRKATKEVIDE